MGMDIMEGHGPEEVRQHKISFQLHCGARCPCTAADREPSVQHCGCTESAQGAVSSVTGLCCCPWIWFRAKLHCRASGASTCPVSGSLGPAWPAPACFPVPSDLSPLEQQVRGDSWPLNAVLSLPLPKREARSMTTNQHGKV